MDRKEIEEKDQELLKDIREIVRRNEEKSSQHKSIFQSMRFWLPALVIVAVVAGMMVFNNSSTSSKPEEPLQRSAEVVDEKPAASDEKSMDLKITYGSDASKPVEEPVKETEASEPVDTTADEKASLTLAASETPPEADEEEPPVADENGPADTQAAASAEAETASEPSTTEPSEAETAPAAKPEAPEKREPAPSIRIAKLVSCAGVQDRQYVSPQSVFSLEKVSKPVVWMTVLTDKPPFTLTHVYYHNDKKYAEVPLEVKYPRMRTWSRLTLSHAYQTGQYRVEVVTDAGEVLGEIEYTDVP